MSNELNSQLEDIDQFKGGRGDINFFCDCYDKLWFSYYVMLIKVIDIIEI